MLVWFFTAMINSVIEEISRSDPREIIIPLIIAYEKPVQISAPLLNQIDNITKSIAEIIRFNTPDKSIFPLSAYLVKQYVEIITANGARIRAIIMVKNKAIFIVWFPMLAQKPVTP